MFSKINHVAIVSENYAMLAKFYEAVFSMKHAGYGRAARAVTVGDGYVGLNINPRRAGRAAGLDHFGIQVADCETAFERMRKTYPTAKWLKRPSNRPFAGIFRQRSRRQRIRHFAKDSRTTAARSMWRTTARPTRATSTMWRCAP